ncbi:MAG: tetratricopeptide repeat protein [Pseudomonadota bacterium]
MAFWVIILLAMGVFSVVWWVWPGLYNVSPQFHYLLIEKNDQPLKLLNGESLHLHPKDRVRVLKISTNISFNVGVRMVTTGFDVNALRYEKLPVATLLPNRESFAQYRFRVEIKHHNHNMGYVDMVVEPYVEDWLDKVNRTIDPARRISILKEAGDFAPKDARIRDRLIEEYKSQKQWSQVARMLEDLAKENPDKRILLDLLETYEAMPLTEGVISVLRRLIRQDPRDVESRLRLATLLEEAKNLSGAIKEYEELLQHVPKEERLPVYKTLGYLLSETAQVQRAIEMYLKAVEMDKKDVNLYYNLSSLYEKAGDKEKADQFLSSAVKLRPDDTESRLALAEGLFKKGNLQGAENDLSEVLRKKPDSIKALLLMINVLEKQGNKKKLKEAYERVHTLDPKNETVAYNLGVLEYEAGNLAKSAPYFERYSKSHPEDVDIHKLLFDIYKREKRDEIAFREAKTLIRLNPKEINPYYYVFEYSNKRGDFGEMTEIVQNGLKHHPNNTDLRQYLVFAYMKTGREDLAIEQLKEISKAKPEDGEVLFQLAKLQEKQGNVQEALDAYERIRQISPGRKEAGQAYLDLLLQVAKVREEEGKLQEALKAYRKILDLSPGNEEAEEAYLRLRIRALPLQKDDE